MFITSIYARWRHKSTGLLAQESGLALPVVMAVLALGALTIAPFLTHASMNLISSQSYEQILQAHYAADSGVGHAIWQLTDGNLSSQLPNVGSNVNYTLPNMVNSIAPSITVTKTVAGGGGSGSTGTITKSVASSLQFDTAGYTPVIFNISTGVDAVLYRDSSNRVVIKTVGIAANGLISQTVIDSLILDTTGLRARYCDGFHRYICRCLSGVFEQGIFSHDTNCGQRHYQPYHYQ